MNYLRYSILVLLLGNPLYAQRPTTHVAPPHSTYGPEYLGYQDKIRVDLDKAMNVMVMDYFNYQNYLNGQSYTYFGGHYNTTPVYIKPPNGGSYYIVIDNGGDSYNIQVSVRVIKPGY